MAYIGRGLDKISNVEVLDNITFDGSSTSFTLQKGSVNFTPSSANNILVSIDGVVQAGNFTCSGSTIDFGVAVSASSVCNFIIHYGVGVITEPSDNSVTAAKIPNGVVSNAHLAGSIDLTSKVTGTLPLGNGGIGATTLAGAGLINTPSWMVKRSASQAISNQVDTVLAFDQERFDTDSAYDNSTNYRFTVPSGKDGKYFVFALVSLTNFATNKPVNVSVRKNGSGFAAFQQTSGDYSDDCAAYVSQIFDASAGDYFDATCFHRGGSSFNANTNTCFGGYKLL